MPKKSTLSLFSRLPKEMEDRIVSQSFPRLHQRCTMRIRSGDTKEALDWSKTSVTKRLSDLHGNRDYLNSKIVRIQTRGHPKPFDLRVDIMEKVDDVKDRDVPVDSDKVIFTPLKGRSSSATKKKKRSKKKKKRSRKLTKRRRV